MLKSQIPQKKKESMSYYILPTTNNNIFPNIADLQRFFRGKLIRTHNQAVTTVSTKFELTTFLQVS